MSGMQTRNLISTDPSYGHGGGAAPTPTSGSSPSDGIPAAARQNPVYVRVSKEGQVLVKGGSHERQLRAMRNALAILEARQSDNPTATTARQIQALRGAMAHHPAAQRT